jgi:hypothetical protein
MGVCFMRGKITGQNELLMKIENESLKYENKMLEQKVWAMRRLLR